MLGPSKYSENRFQSLSGKVYLYSPEEGTLRCGAGSTCEVVVKVTRREVFSGIGNKSFRRFFVDGTLDQRCNSFGKNHSVALPTKMPQATVCGAKQPPCQNFHSSEEYEMVTRSYLKFLSWHVAENGTGHCLEEAVKLVKDFARSYIYIKGYERDYGNRLKELCRKVEMKFSDVTAPLSITSREERSYFPQKLSERYLLLVKA